MNKLIFTLWLTVAAMVSYAQLPDLVKARVDSIEKSLNYQKGVIELSEWIGKLRIPAGFKYLNSEQAGFVLHDLWGNPKSESQSLGLILPENLGVLADSSWVFNIQYEEMGYVKDADADDIDYEQMLKEMKEAQWKPTKRERKKVMNRSPSSDGPPSPFMTKNAKFCTGLKN